MAMKVPPEFETDSGITLPDGILRIDPGHGLQIFEGVDGAPDSMHIIANMYASQAAFEAGKDPVNGSRARYIEATVYSAPPRNVKMGAEGGGGPDGTLRARAHSEEVAEWLRQGKALGYKLLHGLPGMEGFTSDEK